MVKNLLNHKGSIYKDNNNKALVPKLLGQLWILNKLIEVSHMYSRLL